MQGESIVTTPPMKAKIKSKSIFSWFGRLCRQGLRRSIFAVRCRFRLFGRRCAGM